MRYFNVFLPFRQLVILIGNISSKNI